MNRLQARERNASVVFQNAARLAGVNPYRSGVMATITAALANRRTPQNMRLPLRRALRAYVLMKRAADAARESREGRVAPATPPGRRGIAALRRTRFSPDPVVRAPPPGAGILLQRARLRAPGRVAFRNVGFGSAARGRGAYDIVGKAKGMIIDKMLGAATGGLLNRNVLNTIAGGVGSALKALGIMKDYVPHGGGGSVADPGHPFHGHWLEAQGKDAVADPDNPTGIWSTGVI